jgi:hypothetical protein
MRDWEIEGWQGNANLEMDDQMSTKTQERGADDQLMVQRGVWELPGDLEVFCGTVSSEHCHFTTGILGKLPKTRMIDTPRSLHVGYTVHMLEFGGPNNKFEVNGKRQ